MTTLNGGNKYQGSTYNQNNATNVIDENDINNQKSNGSYISREENDNHSLRRQRRKIFEDHASSSPQFRKNNSTLVK
jgi:hypothetical protein